MNQIEEKLSQAVKDMTPDLLEKIIDMPDPVVVPDEWFIKEEDAKRRHRRKVRYRAVAAFALCLVLFAGARLFYMTGLDTTIQLDVNPSIEMGINRANKVCRVRAGNLDGERILDGMKLKKVDYKVAVNAVLGSMMRLGYFNDGSNGILITVKNSNTHKAEMIEADITDDISQLLKENNLSATIYHQQISGKEQGHREIAEKYGISLGKAVFLSKLKECESSLDLDAVSTLPIEEIAQLIDELKLPLDGVIAWEKEETGEESGKADRKEEEGNHWDQEEDDWDEEDDDWDEEDDDWDEEDKEDAVHDDDENDD